ncbi:hypothetical protein Acr_01g0013190 [Actinidia rufa]|uniref:Uncharacterized protein n=1 Tax=Actinidia rufa TaxID=165716 RepID=A0A7J0E517_9ERIC|nr:hypothetical protein Acr_01g0013190 [Actinidia rufa]
MATTSDVTECGGDHERDTLPPIGKGKRGRSADIMASLEARLQRVELAMADDRDKVVDMDQRINGLEGGHEEFHMEMRGILNSLANSWKAQMDALKDSLQAEIAAIKEEIKEVKGDWSLCKMAVTQGGGDHEGEQKPSSPRHSRFNKGKRYGDKPKLSCFLCDGNHFARDCPQRAKLAALIRDDEEEPHQEAKVGSLRLLNAIQAKVGKTKAPRKGRIQEGQAARPPTQGRTRVDKGRQHGGTGLSMELLGTCGYTLGIGVVKWTSRWYQWMTTRLCWGWSSWMGCGHSPSPSPRPCASWVKGAHVWGKGAPPVYMSQDLPFPIRCGIGAHVTHSPTQARDALVTAGHPAYPTTRGALGVKRIMGRVCSDTTCHGRGRTQTMVLGDRKTNKDTGGGWQADAGGRRLLDLRDKNNKKDRLELFQGRLFDGQLSYHCPSMSRVDVGFARNLTGTDAQAAHLPLAIMLSKSQGLRVTPRSTSVVQTGSTCACFAKSEVLATQQRVRVGHTGQSSKLAWSLASSAPARLLLPLTRIGIVLTGVYLLREAWPKRVRNHCAKNWGSHPSPHVVDPPGRVLIPDQSTAEGSHGAVPSHLHVGFNSEYRAWYEECKVEIRHVNNSRSELATALAEEEEEEVGGEEAILVGGNLIEAKPVLVLSSNDEVPQGTCVPPIHEVEGVVVEHSFIGEGEESVKKGTHALWKWLMCDLESDFPSYMLNFGGLSFSGVSIPSISGVNGVWYLGRSCSFGVDLEVLASDLARRFVFAVDAALATSFIRKSPSPLLRLAFKACLSLDPSHGEASRLTALTPNDPLPTLGDGIFKLLPTKTCLSFAISTSTHLMPASMLSSPPGRD